MCIPAITCIIPALLLPRLTGPPYFLLPLLSPHRRAPAPILPTHVHASVPQTSTVLGSMDPGRDQYNSTLNMIGLGDGAPCVDARGNPLPGAVGDSRNGTIALECAADGKVSITLAEAPVCFSSIVLRVPAACVGAAPQLAPAPYSAAMFSERAPAYWPLATGYDVSFLLWLRHTA